MCSVEVANNYLKGILKQNLQTELLSCESKIKDSYSKLVEAHEMKVLLEAPDVYTAAALLISKKFLIGKGDRSAFYDTILSHDPTKIPDLARKLKLLT